MEPIVSLKDVTVRYDETTALESVSLDIYPNDFLGIIGPNGGGKTTLVKAILGALPHSGKVAYAITFTRGSDAKHCSMAARRSSSGKLSRLL